VRTRVLAGTVAACLLAGCGSDGEGPRFGMPRPVTEEGEAILGLWQGFFVAALVVAGVVVGLILYVLLRYRERGDDDAVPNQNDFNLPLEIAYTVTPVLVVAGLFAFSVAVERDATDLTRDPAVVVEVVGFQWQWRFTYLEEGISLIGTPEDGPPELVLPAGEVVRLRLRSDDVNHAFWVPNFLEKRDVIPGVHNEVDLTPTRTGTYVGRCAEFCGLDHWRMGFTVRIVAPEDYAAWVAAEQEAAEQDAAERDAAQQDAAR
jgi:cytochrome c oxidase subunit 2